MRISDIEWKAEIFIDQFALLRDELTQYLLIFTPMLFLLSKILYFLLNPMFWVIGLLVLSIIGKLKKWSKRFVIFAMAIAFVTGNSVLINEFALFWEPEPDEVFAIKHHQSTHIAILLGGYSRYDHQRKRVGFPEAADRIVFSLKYVINKKIDTIILTGGSAAILKTKYFEGREMKKFIMDFGIDSNRIIQESTSRNTFENALYTKKILDGLGWKDSVILITSAYHMRRSKACFRKAGIKVIPYSVDYIGNKTRDYTIEDWLIPRAWAIEKFQVLLKECIGLLSYKISGKI